MIEKICAWILALLAAIILPLYVVIWSFVVMAPGLFPNNKTARRFQDWSLNFWGKVTCAVMRVKVRVHGLENFPKEGALLLFNHQSLVDIIAMQSVSGRIKFGAKIELFKVPFFGQGLRLSRMLPIARNNIQDVIRVYKEAERRAADGELFALAPEGTRQTEDRLGPFKSGPFIFAINAKLPIYPIVLRGMNQILHKGSLLPNKDVWCRTADLYILPPVSTEGWTVEQKNELMAEVRKKMEPYFEKVRRT